MDSTWTGGQYSVYRALLGAFLVVHFAVLLPYGSEVFGAGGTLSTAGLSPYIGVLPNPLAWFDSPAYAQLKPIRHRAGSTRAYIVEGPPPSMP